MFCLKPYFVNLFMPKQVALDRTPELPGFGERIPAARFHISTLNVRVNEPFGESEEDKLLIENLRRAKTVQPFKARPEGNGYGIYVGRRRFLAKCAVGAEAFVVGQDVLIDNASEDDAREASLVENLTVLREEMNPILRARKVQDLIDFNMAGLRAVARKLGLAPSTLSEWTKILQLTPPMQKAVEKGQIFYNDGLNVAKMKVGEFKEEELAVAADTGGRPGFIAEFEKLQTGRGRRGIPKGKYRVTRIMWEERDQEDMRDYQKLEERARAVNMTVDEFCKKQLKKLANA
jgi:ParB family chromosome partitioning protein